MLIRTYNVVLVITLGINRRFNAVYTVLWFRALFTGVRPIEWLSGRG